MVFGLNIKQFAEGMGSPAFKIGVLCIVVAALLSGAGDTRARPALMYFSETDRFGVNFVTGQFEKYDMATLGASWYLNWLATLAPSHSKRRGQYGLF